MKRLHITSMGLVAWLSMGSACAQVAQPGDAQSQPQVVMVSQANHIDREPYRYFLANLIFGTSDCSWTRYALGSFIKRYAGVIGGTMGAIGGMFACQQIVSAGNKNAAPRHLYDTAYLLPLVGFASLWYAAKRLGGILAPFPEHTYTLMTHYCRHWPRNKDRTPEEFRPLCNYVHQDIIAHGAITTLTKKQVTRCTIAMVLVCLDICDTTAMMSPADLAVLKGMLI